MIKLNLGDSHPEYKNQKKKGWTPVDRSKNADVTHDLRKKFPWNDNTVDVIFCSNFIEHITHDEAQLFLKECHRVLKPGARIRMVFPEYSYSSLVPQMYMIEYLAGHKDPSNLEGDEKFVFEMCGPPTHYYAYTAATMKYELHKAGFCSPLDCRIWQSCHAIDKELNPAFLDNNLCCGIIVEALNGE